jgi:hypothetical protein
MPGKATPPTPSLAALKRKDDMVLARCTGAQTCAPDFPRVFVETCRAFALLTHFWTTALEFAW